MPCPRFAPLLTTLMIAACGPGPDSAGKPDSAQTPPAAAPAAAPSGDSAADPGSASGAAATATLEDTRWHLVEVEGKPIAAAAERAQPYIVLFSDQKQAQGFGGCNRMMGSYEQDGDALKFGPLAGTKMACDYPENPEDAFMRALAATASARVVDKRLELADQNGQVVARLEARDPT